VTIHDVAFARRPEDFSPAWRRFALRSHRAAVAHAAAVVTVSEASARDAVAWLRAPSERIVVAPHGPGQDLPLPRERTESHFLYVGDDEPRKNVAGLVEAHARYRAAGGTKPLVLAGAAAGRADDPATLAALYAGALALVHPSREEGFGLTVLEAMATRTPVIAVRNAAIEELTAGAARIVDEAELAQALRDIEADEAGRRALADAGLARAAAFSWQRSAKAHVEAYTLARDSR
jgi:glycosyltransferase involved in cell wall biosynthesis